jgi:hypothetical protein
MSFRTAALSSDHYATKWKMPTEENLNDRLTVNALGIKYARLKNGPEKEATLLEIIQCFHGYLIKYLNMIVRGHLPPLKSPAGRDAAHFLKTLVPKGASEHHGRLTLVNVCRTLHLAFKQQTTDDIYDTLVLCMMRAINKYDPYYTDKVQQICGVIDAKCARKRKTALPRPEFTTDDITGQVGFNCTGALRMLVRKGFLASIAGPKKKVIGYKRAPGWPPPDSFFESGPVGFVYFLPMYFRYYLHEHISGAMGEIESKEHVLQLDHRSFPGDGGQFAGELATPHAEGNFTDSDGSTWTADLTLVNLPMDVSEMTLEWVEKTNDKLFRRLTRKERHILYMVFVKEYRWVEIAAVQDCDPVTVKKQFEQIMAYLRGRARVATA